MLAPATLAALPSTRAIPDRDVFYLGNPDNWSESQEEAIAVTGLAPTSDRKAALLEEVTPGEYTAIVRSANATHRDRPVRSLPTPLMRSSGNMRG